LSLVKHAVYQYKNTFMIRILLVDDQNIMRQGLQALLEPRPDLKVVGTAKDGKIAIEQVENLRPDVVLIDIEMPKMNGITATDRICRRFPQTKVLVLSSHENPKYVASALQAGAKGYLLKNTLTEDLEQAIWSVYRGHSQIDMNQKSIPELKQEQMPQAKKSNLSLKHKNSFQLKRRQIVLTSLILLLASVGISKFETNKTHTQTLTPTQIKPLSVQTTKVQLAKSYQNVQSYTGEVVAMQKSEIGFERGGKLVEVLVDEGDRVKAGTILAKLDASNLAAQRQSLIAQKAQASAKLAELQNGARSEQITAAQASVRDLEKQLELEQLKSDRREYLYAEGAISQEQLDEVAFNSQALSERLANAQSNLDELQNGTRYEQIAAQKAAVEQLSAQITDLEITIAKSTIKAPFSGAIALRYFDQGTVVETGKPVIRLVEDSQLEVKIGVPVDLAAKLSSDSQQAVEIGGKTYPAKVKSILPEVDPATRTRTVILKLAANATVSPQQIARLPITQTVATEGYWLPVTALVKSDRGLWSCYAVATTDSNNPNSKRVERKLIEVLDTNGEKVLVRGTLKEGDAIITKGTQRLVPGQLVSNG
jgi:DNA-binding NarL/FixJ family response regulator/multidrug resistance efflux pump